MRSAAHLQTDERFPLSPSPGCTASFLRISLNMRMKSGQVLKLSSSWVCVSPHLLQRELFGISWRKALQATHTDIASMRDTADVSSYLLMLKCRTPAKQPRPSNRLSRHPSQTFSSLSCRNCERKSRAFDVFVKGLCYASPESGSSLPHHVVGRTIVTISDDAHSPGRVWDERERR